jgi:hypothetical protein
MFPRNAASPEPIAIGAVVAIADGTVQTSGCTVRIKPIGVAEGDGAGTTDYSTDGIVLYTPTQAETNYTSFVLIAKKTACIPVAVTVVTSASATSGKVVLSGETHTSAVIPRVMLVDTTTANSDIGTPTDLGSGATIAAMIADSYGSASASFSSLLSRVGGFAGTGVNTILGFLKALMRKDLAAPSDVGGTFDPAADSVEAISEAITALDVGGGTGARSVTITIDDGSTTLENVKVRVTNGVETYVQETDVTGVATFALNDATWSVRATKYGYTMATQSLVVNGTETATYSMTAVAPSQPANPALVSHDVLCTGIDGEIEVGVEVHYRLTAGTGDAGYSRDSATATATSGADGYATLTFITGATYSIWRGDVGREVSYVASATTPPEIWGAP